MGIFGLSFRVGGRPKGRAVILVGGRGLLVGLGQRVCGFGKGFFSFFQFVFADS